jgi:hypothetical protein
VELNTEEKILKAARKVLFAKGYAGARMQDIAMKQGLTKPYFIIIFAIKKSCLK